MRRWSAASVHRMSASISPKRLPSPLALLRALCTALLFIAVSGCATANKGNQLQETQYAYSGAIRWGDFEGAYNLVDPKVRKEHPVDGLAFERYKQVQISRYSDIGTRELPDGTVERQIDIGVINRNTMAERSARYVERWRFDAEAGGWWNTSGLPDLWQGE